MFAGHGWQRINYMQSTIFSAEVIINNMPAKQGDVVGAFINNECRMIAPIFIVNNKSYVSSVIHGENQEQAEFRIWIEKKDSVIIVPQKITTIPGGNLLNYEIKVVMN